jgi:hypothetical protein
MTMILLAIVHSDNKGSYDEYSDERSELVILYIVPLPEAWDDE